MKIFDYQPVSFIDYPGKIAAVVFMAGCNLRCPYCHNPDVVLGKEEKDSKEFLEFLNSRTKKLDGVVFTGGEPTIQTELLQLMIEVKKLGFEIKLDTNGLKPGEIRRLSCCVDYLALDVKTVPILYHTKLSSRSIEVESRLKESIGIVRGRKERAEIRVTAVRGVIDKGICETIGEMCEGVDKIFVQKTKKSVETLSPLYKMIEPFSSEELEEFKNIFLKYAKNCIIR